MRELVEVLAQSLVDHPEEVTVQETEKDNEILLQTKRLSWKLVSKLTVYACSLCYGRLFLYRIRVSKGLNFPDGLFSRIFDHNIYQRCAASPQDIVAQIFKKISPS